MKEQTNKTIVIYKSKYGSTKQYAKWIAQEVKGDLFENSEVDVSDLQDYDNIVLGGSLHAVGIKGVKVLTENFDRLKDKQLIVFAVGCSPATEDVINHIINHNFIEKMKEKIKFFYLRGAFNYKKLSLIDKLMMLALKFKLKMQKEALDEDAKRLLDSYDNPIDWTDKEAIAPIVEYINR
ncbi:menaquinone-dependent protoporphyrinogen IX oxidase [Orenia metallireducens]|jgi:menaquinone-dependent protoporphyrinogen IX oxidase|uniref:Protoporphyrinogen IX oxidase, menaquinone-dependent (Flavodoxin domain) n=1 Tax=Orenia metallireducens TaxID=1413210 RepID=A0A285HIG6_9FIRM|nr:flavodoxin domain-containing protein [Orenia metallireducens]PRX27215.1 menaquinone-dependent protoporphyrinogen IX oxidase [Orenia metallireducens]SNY35413.1 Protoporphyrinogen IX oxidase, menaquinone-dependent (flavodoxin domain) [Orenia metallireducens]